MVALNFMGKRGQQCFSERFFMFPRFKRHIISTMIVTFGIFAVSILIAWGKNQGAICVGIGLCVGYYAGILRDRELAQASLERALGRTPIAPQEEFQSIYVSTENTGQEI